MPMWPFGRKGRRATKLRAEGPAAVAEGKKPAAAYASQPSGNMPDTTHGVGRSLSRRQSQRKRRASQSITSLQGGEKISLDLEPMQITSEKQHSFPRGSAEDITALPLTKELGTSPHLRPVTQDHEIPYNFQLQSQSHTSIPSARDRGKLQRPQTLRSKRSANDSALPRRKSSKKRKNDHVREEEIRAMSMPLPQKRPAANSGGMLRRDSKKMRSGLNRNLERPTSNISLPLEESIHSSMSGSSETRAFRVSALDMFSPRPKIRCSTGSQYPLSGINTSPQNPSRSESRREKAAMLSKDDKGGTERLKKSRTIDDLADTLDAGALREIMERDKRRRERKRKAEEERMRRRLERRAEKQRAKEQRDQQGTPAAVPDQAKGTVGLGIEKEPSSAQEDVNAPASTERQENRSHLEYPSEGPISRNQFAEKETETTSQRADLPTPAESPIEEPVIATAQAVRYSQASMSPPTSSVDHSRGPSNISQMPNLISEIAAQPVESVEPAEPPKPAEPTAAIQQPPSARRSSEASGRRMGAWASFFRRGGSSGKRESIDRGKSSPSEVSFSNTSRESMSRQMPPAHLVAQPQVRRPSSTPARTLSKFREDLPELPISPPDSRMQSPEATTSSAKPIATRRGYRQPSNLHVDPNAPVPSSSYEDPLSRRRTDSPVSPGAQASGLMSQSLASVDSEGSWLSGKPLKRPSNQAHVRTSVGSASTPKQHEDFSASYEELDDDCRSAQSGDVFAQKPSSTAMAATAESDTEDELQSSPVEPTLREEENIIHTGVGRQPTVVHRQPRVKSTEGLLSYFQADDNSLGTSPSNIDETPEKESPTDDTALVQRAKSVDLGKGHARHLSAGCAKLLDIPAKRASVEHKRASSASQP